MYGIASAEPFKMRIPSPDPELSGAALSKEVPDDPSRTGTIYADQFLAHKCPPNFDDLQRRQFFCVLDLRRLKYAADEIFAKKDWKLNIMNFAKEYEKSRGLIMLRYGLYEFKNVKPSEEVLKRWRAAHNLPEPEPQAEKAVPATPVQSNRRPGALGAVSTKRKAEDDLAPKDNALMASTANQNKRRNVAQEQTEAALTGPAPFKKSKRKADETDEPDENQPNKVQKATPTAAKSKFESILNRAQSGSTSPVKRAPLAPFGSQKPSESQNINLNGKSNPFAASTNIFKPATVETVEESSTTGSVLTGHKVGSVPAKGTSNIFSYLSESSANNSSNENGNVDGGDTETESEGEEEAADSQEASQSAQPSVASSAGTNTPSTQSGSALFSTSNTTAASNIFGSLTKSSDLTSKGGLFGRVQMGSNGQPLRGTVNEEEESANQGASLFGGSSNGGNGGNGAPSFSFTQATPNQNISNPFAPKPTSSFSGTGSFLQAGGDFTGTSSDSPFPAPSSIGTTPVNGTPEPQTQHDDEETPQEQISLINGGPGEEDEMILHEVRAKAIKFVPIVKGSDDEEERKSPWSTQGVGPLRILKNKTSGTVRVLLRAEPRGHIAMNKAILSDVEYKAKEKTVNFVAANDEGSGLETWVLQVKKPESAQQLAGILEANKSANKK
ncbi:uncharacterized protein F4817DRAFT_361421 [Daldinia loculata]|uniref:uncharacterized protein n=1 Tax=Daldinia loculata TaxID=103429 RepID=UPI0020C4FCA9|nr:uncharacterized protein F4817DRAFT_361421 [Daldinia loculata]KAI1643572.1 hypothetical protein F4817DRAFT_361421 [Daldinia loculata]